MTTHEHDHEPVLRWHAEVSAEDLRAARDYLSITTPRPAEFVAALRDREVRWVRANDVLRATRHEPLPLEDPGVRSTLVEVARGAKLRPVLVAGGDIADGYHRVSLAYHLDPFAEVAAVVV